MYLTHTARTSLERLGAAIRLARKRRSLTIADLAAKMEVSSPTVIALENGKPTVSLGVLSTALWVLGLDQELFRLADLHDDKGIELMNKRLPRKVRHVRGDLDNDF